LHPGRQEEQELKRDNKLRNPKIIYCNV